MSLYLSVFVSVYRCVPLSVGQGKSKAKKGILDCIWIDCVCVCVGASVSVYVCLSVKGGSKAKRFCWI